MTLQPLPLQGAEAFPQLELCGPCALGGPLDKYTNMTDSNSTEKRHLAPDTLAASVTILLVANVVQRSIGFGRGILFCRWLTPDELGTWEMAYSFLLLAAPVIVLGLPGSFGRYLERLSPTRPASHVFAANDHLVARPDARRLRVDRLRCTAFFEPDFRPPGSNNARNGLGSESRRRNPASLPGSLVFFAAQVQHRFDDALLPEHLVCRHFARADVVLAIRRGKHRHWLWRRLLDLGRLEFWLGKVGALWRRPARAGISHREFWPPLMRFAFWVWFINLFCHLFGVVDRYMLVHYSGLDNTAALALVGHYHGSRSRADSCSFRSPICSAGVVMPYLSHDWEIGARQRVSDRLNTVLKLTSLVMLAGGVAVLWISPVLFRVAFPRHATTKVWP